MKIFIPKEKFADEPRVPLVLDSLKKLIAAGLEVGFEKGLGKPIGLTDADYKAAGATLVSTRKSGLASAQLIARVNKPPLSEMPSLPKGCIHISHMDPFNDPKLVQSFAKAGITAISMEMMPRTTIAQKMDAISSQANIAGYEAVLIAAERLNRVLPMMMTPAGTLSPARVFVIGAGVAGLQAIATARRLGARVEATDTRPEAEEQVASLGAKFVKAELGETGRTVDGYAKPLTKEQLALQKETTADACARADIVITTAKLFGRKSPTLIDRKMIRRMKPGSVIVDLAIESGGNVEGARLGEEVIVNGVRIVGLANLAGRKNVHASEMYAQNIANLILHFWDQENKVMQIDPAHEIFVGCLITHGGKIVNETIRNLTPASSPPKKKRARKD